MSAVIEARVERRDGKIVVRSPRVGLFAPTFAVGAVVNSHSEIGTIEVLGRHLPVVLPSGCAGQVVALADDRSSRFAVGWDDVLFELDPQIGGGSADVDVAMTTDEGAADAFRSPSSGRFYSRPEPDKPPFVSVGDEIKSGQPVCMLEVMKTYSRIRYDGEPARVSAIRPGDGDDIEEGDVILVLESI